MVEEGGGIARKGSGDAWEKRKFTAGCRFLAEATDIYFLRDLHIV